MSKKAIEIEHRSFRIECVKECTVSLLFRDRGFIRGFKTNIFDGHTLQKFDDVSTFAIL